VISNSWLWTPEPTSFYEKYHEFCSIIVNGGNLKAIDMLKENMITTLQRELSSLFEIQFLVTLVMITLGAGVILPALGADSLLTGIYSTLAIGYFLTQMLFIIVTMLLYFDDQEDACRTTGLFMGSTILVTLITMPFGQAVYGLGFFCFVSAETRLDDSRFFKQPVNN
jgi:uncharacterized membrane protein